MGNNNFERVVGYSSIKSALEQIVDIIVNKEVYNALGATIPRGLLLHGEPGVGKTLMMKCLIDAIGYKSYILRKNKPDGDFVKAIKDSFDEAANNAPSIVFLDDMDKFSESDDSKNHEEYVTIQSCIDEVKDKEVFVIATANDIYDLPKSLLRAGRFDRIIEVHAPKGRDAVDIVAHYLKNKQVADDVHPEAIAKILNGHSCAQLETIINEAGLYAGFNRSDKITMKDFLKAYLYSYYDIPIYHFENKKPVDLSDPTSTDAITIYHESGHAVVSEILFTESVSLITFFNRCENDGGITKTSRDRNHRTIKTIEKDIIIMLAGMAAIDKKFGFRDIGTMSDLDDAFTLLDNIVADSCTSGFTLYRHGRKEAEETISRRESVISAEIERYYSKAKEILSQNNDFFEKIAAELADKKMLYSEDIQRIKAECRIIPANI